MHLSSEYNTKPRAILIHNPVSNAALQSLTKSDLAAHNFSAIPAYTKLHQEYQLLIAALKKADIQIIEIADHVDDKRRAALDQNPNSIFTRDPVITLPWASDVAILSNMTLPERQSEPSLIQPSLKHAGVGRLFTPPPEVRLEGGDILTVIQNDKRTLYVGNGGRTSILAARWLAETLIPADIIDEIVCVTHNKSMLHLDTCFSILPKQTVLCGRGTLEKGFVIDKTLRTRPIEPLPYLHSLGYNITFIAKDLAAEDENCNLLYIGNNTYLAFTMSSTLSSTLESLSGIHIRQLPGVEIAKANGGVHCLTRPIY